MNGRRGRAGIAAITLSLALLAIGVAIAAAGPAGGGPDPSFGNRGVVLPSLPEASARSHFGLISPAAGGRFLLTDVYESDRSEYHSILERREADGSLDPSFGHEGLVGVAAQIDALAEDPAGGVVYSGSWGLKRLDPNGVPDRAFGANARYESADSIAFDAQGRIVVAGTNPEGPRYHPHEGELEVVRLEPDGRLDRTFGANGVVYLGVGEEDRSDVGLLPDGSIVVEGSGLHHLAADGTVLPSFEEPSGEGWSTSLVSFSDGGFAVSRAPYEGPGCTVTRYNPDGSLDQGFALKGVFSDPALSECDLTAAPDGEVLIREAAGLGDGGGSPRLLLLNAAGTPEEGFGNGGSLTASAPTKVPGDAPLSIEGAAFAPGGRIVLVGGAGDAVLLGLVPSGTADPSFGQGGSIVQQASLPSWTKPRAIAAEPDGELVVTGVTDSGSPEERPFWMRFAPDGKLIPASPEAPFASIPYVAAHLRPSGSRYLYALIEKGKEAHYVAKYERDGALVKSFGSEGLVPLPRGFVSTSLVVGPQGSVTAVGRLGFVRMGAFRLTGAGRIAPGFGHHGLATVRFPGAAETQADTGALLAGGDLVLGGLADESLALAELGPDGRLRRGFGSDGFLTCSCGGARPWKVDVASHHGQIYVLDHWKGPRIGEGNSLVDVSAAGRLDRAFAGHGHRLVQVGSPITLSARGGRLIVVGQKSLTSGPVQVREFSLDGSRARSYSGGGRALVAGGSGFRARLSVALQPGGRLVATGEPRAHREFDGSRLELLGLR